MEICMNVLITIAQVFYFTPLWVWGLAAFLFWLGLSQTKARVIAVWRVFLVPVVFAVWGAWGLYLHGANALLPWLLALVPAAALGLRSTCLFQFDPAHQRVSMAGSWYPMARIMAIFWGHYILRASAAVNADASHTLMWLDGLVSGASTGYFVGYGWAFWQVLRREKGVAGTFA
jgi:hypothetical protein